MLTMVPKRKEAPHQQEEAGRQNKKQKTEVPSWLPVSIGTMADALQKFSKTEQQKRNLTSDETSHLIRNEIGNAIEYLWKSEILQNSICLKEDISGYLEAYLEANVLACIKASSKSESSSSEDDDDVEDDGDDGEDDVEDDDEDSDFENKDLIELVAEYESDKRIAEYEKNIAEAEAKTKAEEAKTKAEEAKAKAKEWETKAAEFRAMIDASCKEQVATIEAKYEATFAATFAKNVHEFDELDYEERIKDLTSEKWEEISAVIGSNSEGAPSV